MNFIETSILHMSFCMSFYASIRTFIMKQQDSAKVSLFILLIPFMFAGQRRMPLKAPHLQASRLEAFHLGDSRLRLI